MMSTYSGSERQSAVNSSVLNGLHPPSGSRRNVNGCWQSFRGQRCRFLSPASEAVFWNFRSKHERQTLWRHGRLLAPSCGMFPQTTHWIQQTKDKIRHRPHHLTLTHIISLYVLYWIHACNNSDIANIMSGVLWFKLSSEIIPTQGKNWRGVGPSL